MYFVMQSTVPAGHGPIRLEEVDKSYTQSWLLGARFEDSERPPNPYVLRVNQELGGTVLMDLYQTPAVLMSKRLLAALRDAGVDNLDVYPARIIDEEEGKTYQSHDAVNIIGAISAADLETTQFDPGVPDRVLSAAIDRLGVDESAARGQRLFRLAESINAIVVDEGVKKRVESEGITTVVFTKPDDWSSL